MSIDIDKMPMLEKRYKEIEEKVISILGFNPLDSNHYYDAMLYGERIDLETTNEKIIEIYNKFEKLYEDIEDIFNKNNLELKDEYFMTDDMSGSLKFLGTAINVNIGIKGLLPTIDDFIKMNNKIKAIASKYGGIDERYFYQINSNNKFNYVLYGVTINSNIGALELEEIISSYYQLNLRVNKLLKTSNYKNKNLIYPYREIYTYPHREEKATYFLFAQRINQNTPNDEILKIINSAQLLESNLKCVIKELKITTKYEIKYTDEVWLWSEVSGTKLTLNMSYEDIKKIVADSQF